MLYHNESTTAGRWGAEGPSMPVLIGVAGEDGTIAEE